MNIPNDDNKKVEHVPERSKVGSMMAHKTLCYYLHNTFNPKDTNKKQLQCILKKNWS